MLIKYRVKQFHVFSIVEKIGKLVSIEGAANSKSGWDVREQRPAQNEVFKRYFVVFNLI